MTEHEPSVNTLESVKAVQSGRRFTTREIVLVGLFTGLVCIVSLIFKLGGEILVPFSFITIMSLLTGALLGGRLGAMSMLVYALMGLVGIPVFAKAPYGGPMYFLQPTAGFIIGFILAALITGKLLEKHPDANLGRIAVAMLAGLAAIYAVGMPYLWMIVNFYLGSTMSAMAVVKAAFIPFIGMDLVKLALGAVLVQMIRRRIRI